MNMILNQHYMTRFTRLPEVTQTEILERIDQGFHIVSTYNLNDGLCRCLLTGEVPRILWEEVISKPELAILGLEAQDVLNQFQPSRQQLINEALEAGAEIIVAVRHDGEGGMEVFVSRDGQHVFLGKLQFEDEVRH